MVGPVITGTAWHDGMFQADPSATPGDIENALKSTAHRYTAGSPSQQVGPYLTSYDKGTGLVDVVAAATSLGATT